MPESIHYIEAKARVVRAISRVTSFVKASVDFNAEKTSVGKRAKLRQMLSELTEIRRNVENDIQIMESAVGNKTAPIDVTDNKCSSSLAESFDTMFYELAAFADVHSFSLTTKMDATNTTMMNQTSGLNNLSIFQLPKRKFPTFSGNLVEWQGFEELFQSILSHAPDLPDVERFEYLKTSLEGEALSLVSHLALTSTNYISAWEILRSRYGNKRDLAKIHLDALMTPCIVKWNDAASIKTTINTILEHTSALDNLEFVTRQWSPILLHILESRLDFELRSRWEHIVGDKHNPQIGEFIDFLRSHIRSAEVLPQSSTRSSDIASTKRPFKPSQSSNSKPRHGSHQKVLSATSSQPANVSCSLCKKSHSVRKCQLFIDQVPSERFKLAKLHQLCINCLGSGHSAANCPSKYKCQTCHKMHHTLLHFGATSGGSPNSAPGAADHQPITSSVNSMLIQGQPKKIVLLSTISLDVIGGDGSYHPLRALVDSGSQASFITEKSACLLMLRRSKSTVNISTFNSNTCTPVRGKTTIAITPSGRTTPSIHVEVLIVPTITTCTPQQQIVPGTWSHVANLPLADPLYHTPGEVDILLGADILPSLLLDGKISGDCGEPMAIETVFGWILTGPVWSQSQTSPITLCIETSDQLNGTLKRFWEIEELPSVHHLSADDIETEEFYKSTTTRLISGRFILRLPFRKPFPLLGDSKTIALQRLKALEIRLSKNADVRQQYVEFMQDYVTAGHMELIPPETIDTPHSYYIPHHCILRPDSKTTKLRVVFNASAQTTTGTSLNDSMYTGPKLQPDIQSVLLRARLWKYLFVADIKQMYRQILIHPDDRDYQRILWRFSPTSDVQEYRLCTVTYGTSAAPFLALRTIREVAIVDGAQSPRAATVLLNDTFVDDVLTGANSVDEALECQQQLIQLCSQAQFELRKWASNCSEVLRAVPEDSRAMSPLVLLDNSDDPELKILGLNWSPSSDTLTFKTHPPKKHPTKRSILSDIARVFDPLGLLSPITLLTKHLMQRLWTDGVGWDDPVSAEITRLWSRYQSELHQIGTLSIRRRLTYDHACSLQLHAFSDSSEKGYAAAVYLRVETPTSVHCHLVSGKSKVTPLKRCTIPRLELCGAVLAARLLHFVASTYADRLRIDEQHAWTDSTTALVWIQSSPHRWATFIANRTSQIQELTSPSIWRYVPTDQNPVDCASRGLFPAELVNHPLWWTGPPYILESSDKWPPTLVSQPPDIDTATKYEPRKTTVLHVSVNSSITNLLNRFSSLAKVLRIMSYVRRWKKLRHSILESTAVTAEELALALSALIHFTQRMSYSDDIARLEKGLQTSKDLRSLDLFIDPSGLVRVGGRLKNANIPYAHKHPALLPSNHPLTKLLIDHHHRRLNHPGAYTLQAYLQQEYWIQSARRTIRSRLRLCISCFKTRPKCVEPKMAVLPKYRVQQIKPFAITGVDYAGPIVIKRARGRSSITTSAYICLFVCTATKALHLELSSDLTTETFLLAFTRFIARRGPIHEMHSDCGTNFVGASRLLTPEETLTHSTSFQDQIHQQLAKSGVSWHFNPPSSPHFGGLWEAGVKSTKSLILRSIGTQKLTGEELMTLLTQIEATLNSRPLSALSNDPSDLCALTPSHFLTLDPSINLPEPNLEKISLSHLQRWRLINDLHNHFWARWKTEYLSSLQRRSKWSGNHGKLTTGDLVLIKEATPPLHWRIGRIMKLHPGSDGISRVATVRTASGLLTRPAVKLCPLPCS